MLRRGNIVNRYHTEPMVVGETVGHHCANVGCILIHMHHPDLPSREIMVHALLHDVAEQYTGDIPAPVKETHSRVADAIKRAEEEWEAVNVSTTLQMDEYDALVFKFADSFDCLLKCVDELRMGNINFKPIYVRAEQYAVEAARQLHVPFHKLAMEMLAEAQQEVLKCPQMMFK